MEKIWEIKDPEQYLKTHWPRKRRGGPPARIGRDPGRAYTLSLLFWGAGQSYNEEHGKALFFEVLLTVLLVAAGVCFLFRERILLFLELQRISLSLAFVLVQAVFFSALAVWASVAGDAYRRAASSRSTAYTGTASRVSPGLCSLLFPGWGQFLNGQPLKGSFFSAVSVFGIFAAASIPATLLTARFLDDSGARFVVEALFTITVLYAPAIPLLWLISAYDALKVSLDEYKKEPLWVRIKAANNRRRTQGMVRGVFPQFRSTLFLVLFLAGLWLIASRTFPASFYARLLGAASAGLRARGITLLPDIIDQVIPAIAHTGDPS